MAVGPGGVEGALLARGVLAGEVAHNGGNERLVVGGPVGHPVAQPLGDDAGVLGKGLGRLPLGPAAAVLKGLGQVPVVKGDERLDAGLAQPIHQAVVKVQAGRVDLSRSFGKDARPGDGETIGRQAQFLHQADVLPPAVVVVGGDVAGVALPDLARLPTEGVPDGGAAAVFIHRSLDLVGRGGRAPDKAFGKTQKMLGHEASFSVVLLRLVPPFR